MSLKAPESRWLVTLVSTFEIALEIEIGPS